MNILFYYAITVSPKHGGISMVTLSLMEQFRKDGHEVYCLSAKKTNESEDKNQYYLPNESESKCYENKCYFINFLKIHTIDILINQNGTTPTKDEAIVWGNEANVPVITVLHNSLFGIYGIHQKRLIKYHPIINFFNLGEIFNEIIHYYFKCKYGKYYKEQVKYSAQVVLLSKQFIPEIKYFSGIDIGNITTIPNPLTIKSTKSKQIKQKEILYVGRISYEKNVDILLKIWKDLQFKYLDWRLTIVGDGPLKTKMELMSTKLRLQRISFEGYKDPTPYYERASIFCMTSAFEGFGLVLVEAMSRGVVPLAFNSYLNVSEIIDNDENGFLIPPFDINKYTKKLSFLMEEDKKRILMAQNAIIKSNNYRIDVISKKWILLFDSIIKK